MCSSASPAEANEATQGKGLAGPRRGRLTPGSRGLIHPGERTVAHAVVAAARGGTVERVVFAGGRPTWRAPTAGLATRSVPSFRCIEEQVVSSGCCTRWRADADPHVAVRIGGEIHSEGASPRRCCHSSPRATVLPAERRRPRRAGPTRMISWHHGRRGARRGALPHTVVVTNAHHDAPGRLAVKWLCKLARELHPDTSSRRRGALQGDLAGRGWRLSTPEKRARIRRRPEPPVRPGGFGFEDTTSRCSLRRRARRGPRRDPSGEATRSCTPRLCVQEATFGVARDVVVILPRTSRHVPRARAARPGPSRVPASRAAGAASSTRRPVPPRPGATVDRPVPRCGARHDDPNFRAPVLGPGADESPPHHHRHPGGGRDRDAHPACRRRRRRAGGGGRGDLYVRDPREVAQDVRAAR